MVRENLKVLVEYHPFHESVNKKILEEKYNFLYNPLVDGYNSNIRANRTLGDLNTKGIMLVKEWITTLIRQKYPGFPISRIFLLKSG